MPLCQMRCGIMEWLNYFVKKAFEEIAAPNEGGHISN